MELEITTQYIKLQQLLKLGGVLGQGSDIKALLAQGSVTVNGEKATQRGKKIGPGDIVIVDGFGTISVVYAQSKA